MQLNRFELNLVFGKFPITYTWNDFTLSKVSKVNLISVNF